jgi:hypothetical protein
MEHFVHALFRDRQHATRAVDALVNSNFAPTEIGALVADERMHVEELVIARKTIVIGGLVVGFLVGAVGGIVVLTSLGLIALGTPAGVFTGAALGALFGLFAGGLGGLGYWRYVIDFPRQELRVGTILVGVATQRARVDEARRALGSAGARRTHVSSKRLATQRALSWARNNVFANSPDPQGR